MSISNFYLKLKDTYLDPLRRNDDKARQFRVHFEDFLRYVTNQESNLNSLLQDFFKQHKIREVNNLCHILKKKLSEIAHENIVPNNDTLYYYYESLIRVIFITTEVYPDSSILTTIGVKKIDYLQELNEQQRDAVLSESQITYVNAGPGTGKTRLLVYKILHYIKNAQAQEKIVALSYTNTAASELGSKVMSKIFYEEKSNYKFYSGTIHSFAFNALKSYHASINSDEFNFIILGDDEIDDLAVNIYHQLNPKYSIKTILKVLLNKVEIKDNNYEDIIEIRNQYKFITFPEILEVFYKQIQNNTDFISWLSKNMTILLIDEAQDLSKLNYKIINVLIDKLQSLKLFFVGDPRQNIFSFIGGSYQHLNNFLDLRKEIVSFKVLNLSYRCPNSVFNFVNKFQFLDNSNSPIKSLNKENTDIILKEFENKLSEANYIVELIMSSGNYNQIGILCSSLKYLDVIARILNSNRIPFKVYGGTKKLKSHMRFFLHTLKIIDNNKNLFSWQYLYNSLSNDSSDNKIGLNEIKIKIQQFPSGNNFIDLINDLSEASLTPSDIISKIYIIFEGHILARFKENSNSSLIQEDIEDFKEISSVFPTINDLLLSFSLKNESFKKFYKKDLEVGSIIEATDQAITLSTIHSSKGLEWNTVILPGLCDGIFPNPFFCDDVDQKVQDENYDNELKKLYVASTRTKCNLILTYPLVFNNGGNTFRGSKSRFLSYYYE